MEHSPWTGRDWLAIAATAFLAANLLHGADHLRQGMAGLNIPIKVGGALLTAAAVVACGRRRDPRAPLLAVVVGFTAAVLVAASHIAPHWSMLSASYIDDVDADALAWAVMLLEVATAFLLGVAGVHAMRARSGGANDAGALAHGRERAATY